MGLLALGTPFDWSEAKQHAGLVRQRGIQQFLKLWHDLERRTGDQPLWGDEIEYFLISLNHTSRQANLALRQEEILESLRRASTSPLPSTIDTRPTFHQEYGRYMLESTPGRPYCSSLEDCLCVEPNMRYRRKLIQSKLAEDEILVTLTSFPRLGTPGVFTEPYHTPCGPVAHSLYLPDQIINQHIRFPTLTRNIRERRGSKVAIFVPIFQDENTATPFRDPTVPSEDPEILIAPDSDPDSLGDLNPPLTNGNLHPNDNDRINIPKIPDNQIYLDAMGFGMGCSCLQTTFQACSITQARLLYDTLVPVAPIMMALSAAAPIFKGFLADVDSRWNVIAGAVDDRTESERDSLNSNQKFIPKSRYDSVSLYIADNALHRPEYDDILAPVDKSIESELIKSGVDRIMARHVAHLFIRDPLVIFSETLELSHEDQTGHFENLQSTNWQSVRFKPPPSSSSGIGWRVEFRSMEVQITDFENAAYSIFIVLLIRAILTFNVNFYIPISKVDENMRRAQQRDAVRTNRFHFRTQVLPNASTSTLLPPEQLNGMGSAQSNVLQSESAELTIDEIIHGKTSSHYPGLMKLVEAYVDQTEADDQVKAQINRYLALISARASGKLMTTAAYIRKFVQDHPAYQRDSVVTSEMNYDLICRAKDIETGKVQAEDLLGTDYYLNLTD